MVPEAVAKSVSRAQRVASGTGLANSREGESECIYVTFASRSVPPSFAHLIGLQSRCKFSARRRFGSAVAVTATAAAAKTRARRAAAVAALAAAAVAGSATAKFHSDSEFLIFFSNHIRQAKNTS